MLCFDFFIYYYNYFHMSFKDVYFIFVIISLFNKIFIAISAYLKIAKFLLTRRSSINRIMRRHIECIWCLKFPVGNIVRFASGFCGGSQVWWRIYELLTSLPSSWGNKVWGQRIFETIGRGQDYLFYSILVFEEYSYIIFKINLRIIGILTSFSLD